MGKIQGSKWKCPNCGRVFSRKDQAHYCGKPKTVDEYIAAQEEDVRSRLEEVRAVIREAIPDAEERISWSEQRTSRSGFPVPAFYPAASAAKRGGSSCEKNRS